MSNQKSNQNSGTNNGDRSTSTTPTPTSPSNQCRSIHPEPSSNQSTPDLPQPHQKPSADPSSSLNCNHRPPQHHHTHQNKRPLSARTNLPRQPTPSTHPRPPHPSKEHAALADPDATALRFRSYSLSTPSQPSQTQSGRIVGHPTTMAHSTPQSPSITSRHYISTQRTP